MVLPRLDDGLLAYNPFSVNFSFASVGVNDVPVATEQTDGMIALVFDGDAVGKHEFVAQRFGIFRLIVGLHTDFNAFCCFGYHLTCIAFC